MANRPKGYGYTREMANKIDSKYSDEDEQELVSWIQNITGESPCGEGKEAFHKWLKDGHVLCKLMMELQPDADKKIKVNDTSSSGEAMKKAKENENIGNFLKAAASYGVKDIDSFQTVDLYEGGNLAQVQTFLFKLAAEARRHDYKGALIGIKLAEKNERDLSEQQLREGRNVIGLQMGTNQVASQSGMTAYGLGRQLTPNTK